MRFFALLFSFYFLALACIPCADAEICNEMETKSSHQSDNHKNSEDNSGDHCSPLCYCACCATSVNKPTLVIFKIKKLEFSTPKYAAFKHAFYASLSKTIWHPPKFA